jgi:hypothetical protein
MRRLIQQQEMTGPFHNTSQVVDDSGQLGSPQRHTTRHNRKGRFKSGSGMLHMMTIALALFLIIDLGANAVRIPDANLNK